MTKEDEKPYIIMKELTKTNLIFYIFLSLIQNRKERSLLLNIRKVYKILNILLIMVRNKTEWRTITISQNLYDRLEEDRKHFEKNIGGGKWSMNDTLSEWIKILDNLKQKEK